MDTEISEVYDDNLDAGEDFGTLSDRIVKRLRSHIVAINKSVRKAMSDHIRSVARLPVSQIARGGSHRLMREFGMRYINNMVAMLVPAGERDHPAIAAFVDRRYNSSWRDANVQYQAGRSVSRTGEDARKILYRIVHAINLLPLVSTDAQYAAAVWEVISDPVFMNGRSPGVILTGMGLAGLISGLLEFVQQDHITTLRGQPLRQGQFLSGAVGLFALAQVLHDVATCPSGVP